MKGPEDDLGLSGKVAIVSGGGAAGDGIGNGRAAAILLARSGTKVVVADLDKKLAERTVEMIQAEGGTAIAHGFDATKESDCRGLIDAAVDHWGRLDFLDNNIGIGSRGSVVPVFQEQRRTGRVTVTDERMTRFWITLPQAVDLVLHALETMEGGEVFIPKIPSMRVVDLAEASRNHPDLVLGLSPRATLQLSRACRARAASQGRDYAVPDDVKAVAVPVLAHRLSLRPESAARGMTTEMAVHDVLAATRPSD